MRIHYIYKITNTINNKIYIGQTVNPRARWYAHKKESERDIPRVVISGAIKKYGSIVFIFELIACCKSFEEANFVETEIISQYKSNNSTIGYNATFGGMNAPKTEEWKRKVSEKLMGHKVSQETRDKVSKGNTGKIRSLETKQQISESMTGKNRSEEHKNNLSNSLKGNKNCLGNIQSDETREKISKANKGKKPTNIAIQKSLEKTKNKTWKLINGKRVWMIKNDN